MTRPPGRVLMVWGTGSSVGKSLLVTALCRSYARRGVRVAPFKAQNMSLNAAVTADGAEIGRAQWVQAQAARVAPTADMNPILLKPEGLLSSQIVLRGRAVGRASFHDYHARGDELRQAIDESLSRLRALNELVLIEGAGSPAEVNLRDRDLANLYTARAADARVLLVGDIERGGVFASMLGTLALLDGDDRARVGALVVNKLHGEPALFADGVRFLESRSGLPVAVLRHLGDAGIASEDSLELAPSKGPRRGAQAIIAVVRLPHLSNFDEFEPLQREPGLAVRFCDRPAEIDGAQLVIVPGSKRTVADLAWLRASGIAAALVERAQARRPILGICGGCQMLGRRIVDDGGVESGSTETPGLALLPVETRFAADKRTAAVRLRLAEGAPLLGAAGGAQVSGYQIHHGRVIADGAARAFGTLDDGCSDGAIAPGGHVAGTTLHGLFENEVVRAALRAALGLAASSTARADPYDRLADAVDEALDLRLLDRLAGLDV